MPLLRSHCEAGDSSCEVLLHEDEKPPVIDISVNNGQLLRFTIPEATVLHAGLGQALEMFVSTLIGEETYH